MNKAEKIAKKLKNFNAEIGIILGSGYENLIELENVKVVDYKSLGFEFCEVKGHLRQFTFGEYKSKKIVLISRFHYYESGTTENIFLLFNVLSLIGVKTIFATTAVGGVNPDFKAGDMMLIKSHINLCGVNPLIAKQPVKFVDLSNAYDKDLRKLIIKTAKKLEIEICEGVHLQTSGPSYETPAEVDFYKKIGADTVSMSTALDCICARNFDIKFVALAGITNKAVSEKTGAISHDDVLEISRKICKKLSKIVEAVLPLI